MGSREEQAEKGLENMQTGEDKQFGGGGLIHILERRPANS